MFGCRGNAPYHTFKAQFVLSRNKEIVYVTVSSVILDSYVTHNFKRGFLGDFKVYRTQCDCFEILSCFIGLVNKSVRLDKFSAIKILTHRVYLNQLHTDHCYL